MIREPIYFGCAGENQAGHHPFRTNRRLAPYDFRWMANLDGILPPLGTCNYGDATLSYIHGYTVVAFWDHTGDKRTVSNSAFFIPGTLSFDETLTEARKQFPWVFSRFDGKLEITFFDEE